MPSVDLVSSHFFFQNKVSKAIFLTFLAKVCCSSKVRKGPGEGAGNESPDQGRSTMVSPQGAEEDAVNVSGLCEAKQEYTVPCLPLPATTGEMATEASRTARKTLPTETPMASGH